MSTQPNEPGSSSPPRSSIENFQRLVRSLSSSIRTRTTNSPDPNPGSAPDTPKGGLTTFELFNTAINQIRKGKELPTEFPPSHWSEEENAIRAQTKAANGGEDEGEEAALRIVETTPADAPLPPTPSADSITEARDAGTNAGTPSTETTPEPSWLARKIRDMMMSASLADPSQSGASPTQDSRLAKLLSNASIMNGSVTGVSVWSLLDKLKSPFVTRASKKDEGGKEGADGVNEEEESSDDDDSSIMLYGPLIPEAGSSVELARSEVISLDSNDDGIGGREDQSTPTQEAGAGARPDAAGKPTWKWPWKGKGKEDGRVHLHKERKVWVPSKDKVSLELMWWGFRIYLPPPVMRGLDSSHLETAKRAALLTTAIQWLLANIPVALLPPQVRPALALARRLVPYAGYLGAFGAWSWGAVKAFDKGDGVTLTATWLLTFALIPGTLYRPLEWDMDASSDTPQQSSTPTTESTQNQLPSTPQSPTPTPSTKV